MSFFSLFIGTAYGKDLEPAKEKTYDYLAIIFATFGSVISLSGLGVVKVNEKLGSTGLFQGYSIVPGSLYYLLLAIFISSAICLGIRIVSTYRVAGGKRRDSLRTVITGLAVAVPLSIVTNLIGPLVFSDSLVASTLSNLAIIFFVLSVAYSIIKHAFLDIRTSAVRLVGYFFSIATLVFLYSLVIYGIVLPIVSPGEKFKPSVLLMIALGTVGTIYFYDKIKLLFDTITDRLFFKNGYDLPKFLDEFNQALITSSDVGELSSSIFKVMGDNIKTEFFVLVVKHGNFEITIDSRKQESIREADAKVPLSLINYHFKGGNRVVLTDYMNKEKFDGLHQSLTEMDALAAIDLSEGSKTTSSLKKVLASGDFKAMYLGPKRSGESYNAQDLDALRIISKELVVGLQNAMRFEEIKLFNLELQHKVDLATGKLRDQNKKLILADELKDDFLSIASHQMRTPISAINGYASILNSGDAGKLNKNQQKFAKIIEESTKKLSYLINDFLTVSRLKSGKFSIEKSDTNLKTLLKSEVEGLTAQFKSKDVKLRVTIDEKIPNIQADESKIRQVMMNLIDNALYYTPSDGEVNVTLKKTSQGIVFEVRDSGIGVPKEDQHKLFAKMYRASNAQKMRPDGTGLGLYLAKKVILGHHGHIIFNSIEGQGSTFGFRIPTR
ncbi:MAG: HAMP domain-containing histidine kinase [Candidatus Nomurabacteria bacterium]|nr:MAG: HAMP domain-containing histidine kinase [Candidatus Nomurabacteria bacterium]